MELDININTCDGCKVIIQDNSEYLPETSTKINKGKFKFSDTISIDVLQHVKGQRTITYTIHDTSKYIEIPVNLDGKFTVTHIILPSKKWFESELLKTEGSNIGIYNIVYFSDGISIYKYINGDLQEINIDEVLLINQVNTTISKIEREFISICFLRKCYINLCQEIFNNKLFSPCYDRNTSNKELSYKRDLIWMAINVIKYLTECNQLEEVQRIIDIIQGCNGICPQITLTKNKNGCGCS